MQALLDEDNREPARRFEADDHILDLIHDRRLDAFRRFIEQQDFGIRQNCPPDGQLLLLPAAQHTARPIENLGELGEKRKTSSNAAFSECAVRRCWPLPRTPAVSFHAPSNAG